VCLHFGTGLGVPMAVSEAAPPPPLVFCVVEAMRSVRFIQKKAFSSTLDFELAERSFVFANRKWKPPKFVDSGDDFLYALSIWGSELALFLRLSPF
jgi:hypothetical protein